MKEQYADIVLDIPIPPSVNRTRRVNWASLEDYKRWQRDADKYLMLHRQTKQTAILGKYEIRIAVNIDSLRGDLDNILKALLDYVVSRGFVADDRKRFLKRIVMEFATEPLPEGCRVTVMAET